MPRARWMKPVSDRRLSDLVSVGLLTKVFPPDLVDEVIESVGRTEQRNRSLPARVMAPMNDVLAQLTDGPSRSSMWEESWSPPSKSAIFQVRARLAPESIRQPFARVARPLATPDARGASIAGRRLVAIDGTCFDVADADENATL